jgi:hypothetical protein
MAKIAQKANSNGMKAEWKSIGAKKISKPTET